jgi:hypothetical protein
MRADYEMLELVLFRAIPRRDVKPLAKALIARFGSFAEVIAAPAPRLQEIDGLGEAAGADMSRVFFVEGVEDRGESRAFDPSKDVSALQTAITGAGGAGLLIVDPVVSAVSGDSHKNGETRRALQPLVDLASEACACLLGITHFSKGARSFGAYHGVYRVWGAASCCSSRGKGSRHTRRCAAETNSCACEGKQRPRRRRVLLLPATGAFACRPYRGFAR